MPECPPDGSAPKEIELGLRIKPKKWEEFQHYKHRSPPWVKLQKSLLDDFDFHCLPVASRALAPMLWLIASESIDGFFDADPKKLAFRLRASANEIALAIKPLIDNGFFVAMRDASDVLSNCKHDAMPETETETETETPAIAAAFCFKTELLNLGVHADLADDWMKVRKAKKATNSKSAFNLFRREVEKSGWSAADAISHCIKKDWKGFEAEWVKDVKLVVISPTITAEQAAANKKAMLAEAKEAYKAQMERESV